jgi:hypothetical protein
MKPKLKGVGRKFTRDDLYAIIEIILLLIIILLMLLGHG